MLQTRTAQQETTPTQQEWKSRGSRVACGPDATYCGAAIEANYDENLRSDGCALETREKGNKFSRDRAFWVPPYQRDDCKSSGFVNCSQQGSFGPRKIAQESLLQGRGQVTSNPGCPGGFYTYLPEDAFEKTAKPNSHANMDLFAQPTVSLRSCSSLTEVDLQERMDPLPGLRQNAWAPFPGAPRGGKPPPRIYGESAPQERQTMTLGTRDKYPSWQELEDKSKPYQDNR